MTSWIDISQPLNNQLAGWPEDERFYYDTPVTKDMSGSVNIGRIKSGVHAGTHVDAPFHFRNDGAKILDIALDRYIGPCRVIDVHLEKQIDQAALKKVLTTPVERLLIRTSLPNSPTYFPEDVTAITPDGAAYMADMGVKLVGVDTPSVDAIASQTLPAHHALYAHDIFILENVMLDHVDTGDYELSALPLPLQDADGSFVRAAIKPYQ